MSNARVPRRAGSRSLAAVFMTFGALAVSCSPGNETETGGNGGSGGADDPGSGGTGASGGGFNTDGGGPSGTAICSADLKHVLDESGNIIETCGPGLGCGGGMCIPACDAAAASKGSVGCDFLVATPYFLGTIAPPCFATFVTNNWDQDVTITVSRAGQPYDVAQFGRIAQTDPNVATWPAVPATGLPPGEVAVLFLSDDPSSFNLNPLTCPIQPALRASGGSAVPGSGVGTGWSIETSAPVTLYDILPYGGADSYLPSAELVLPTTAWGTNYVAALSPMSGAGGGTMWGQVLATEPTTVTILPSVALPGVGAIPALPAGVTGTFALEAGQYIQWNGAEMTGSVIQTDKPVAFTGGNTYQCYSSATSSGGGCDSGHQQIAPVSAVGSEYIGMPFRSRSLTLQEESIPYRIVGMKDGTALTFDPPIPTAPTTLSLGQSVTFETSSAFRVSSQSAEFPFYVGQVMPGCLVTGGDTNNCPGDEDFINMLPPPQWLARYVFFSDPTYPTTNLVFVRKRTNGAFADVTLECHGVVSGWQPVGTSGEYEITTVDLIRNGAPNGACNNGPQLADSAAPFGLVVWGLDYASSYGYPAGGNATTINAVVVPPVR